MNNSAGKLESCKYAGGKDLQLMIDLLTAVRPSDWLTDYPGILDLRERLALTSVQENTRLWFDADDRMVGFAFVDPYNNLCFEIDRQGAPPDIETQIVEWGMACLRRDDKGGEGSLTLDASCRGDDEPRLAMLARFGFVQSVLRTLYMARDLTEPIPTSHLPPGFHIHPVAGEGDVDGLVALHRAAFGTEKMTVEQRLAMMQDPGYEPELDLVVVAPDGQFAAYCMCTISREQNERTGRNEGYTDPIATHPDYQRRGLARALLLTGFRKLKQRGIEIALLGTSSENIPMQRTARSVGFRVLSTKLWLAKSVSQDQKAG